MNKHKEPDFGSKAMSEYLLGSRRLKVFPVAMSLVARLVLFLESDCDLNNFVFK